MESDIPNKPQNTTDVEMLSTEKVSQVEMPVMRSAIKRTPGVQRVLSSGQLFSAANEVLIEHAGLIYRLRITQANKLILTK